MHEDDDDGASFLAKPDKEERNVSVSQRGTMDRLAKLKQLQRQYKDLQRAIAEEERAEREQAKQTERDRWAAEYRMQRDALLQSRFKSWQEMLTRLTAGEFKTRKALGAAYGMRQRMTAHFLRVIVDAGRMSRDQLETCFVRRRRQRKITQ